MAKRNPFRSGQCHSMAGPLAGSGTHAPDGEPAALPHQRAAGPLEAVGLPSAHLAVLGGGRPAGTASGGIPAAAGSGQGPGKPARVLSCKGVRLPGTQCPRAAFADGGGGGQRLGTSGGRAAQVPPPLPATGIGRVHPRHGNPRGAGVYHPVGESHEPHQRHHGHSAPGKKRRRGAGKVQPTLLAEAVSGHAPGLSTAGDAAGGAGSQQPGGARAGGCGMVRGAGRPLAWEGKLVNILSQRGGQKRTQQAPGKSWTGCLFRIYSWLWTGWSGPAAAAPLARPKRGGERPSFFSF